jgi:hypothetical protein
MIMEMYEEAGFMEKGRWGWTDSYELESRLDVLMHFKNKLLKDTGRSTIKSGDVHNEDSVAIEQLKTIAMEWFSTDDPAERQKAYEDFLQNEFKISLYPTAEELNGPWSSTSIVITEYDLGPPPPESGSSESSGEGCDLSDLDMYNMLKAGIEENMDKPLPVAMDFDLSSGGSGIINLVDEDGSPTPLTANYNNGLITASTVEEGSTVTFSGTVRKANEAISLTGSFKIEIGEAWIRGSWTGAK